MGTYKYIIPKEYIYEQSTPSQTWVINYPFTGSASVDIAVDLNGVLTKIIPQSVNQISQNRVDVVFSQPYTGKAHLVI